MTRTTRVWHPFSQMNLEKPLKVEKGEGVYLQLADGRRVIDAISSWWVNLHGHGNARMAQAISEQAKKLEHVIFSGFTHDPAERLAEKVTAHLPGELSQVFYSDNGSTAVEVALKMAFQYWQNIGQPSRRTFVSFDGAYHGDTIGAMSVGDWSGFTSAFDELRFDVQRISYPFTFAGDPEVERKEVRCLQQLEEFLDREGKQCSAVIIEPLVQGAGGMRFCRPEFMRNLEGVVKKSGTLLIYDEVLTGFGRTGDWFACTKSKTVPDIICLSKGLTGGALPLAMTVTSERIYKSFLGPDLSNAFLHGHSYTANPIACAAGIASCEMLEENEEMFRGIEPWHEFEFEKLTRNSKLTRFRTCGTIAAMDVVTKEETGYRNSIGAELRKRFLSEGVLLRPLGNTLYVMPPYCITREQLAQVYEAVSRVV